MGTGSAAWEPQLEHVDGRMCVLAPDLPGFGGSEGPFSIPRAVAAIASLLDERGADEAVVCGLSLGALVALRFALSHPERTRALGLVAGFAALPDELREQQLSMAFEIEQTPADELESVLDQLVAPVPPGYRKGARHALSGFNSVTLAGLVREASLFDVAAECSVYKGPAIVAWGADDELNAGLGQELAALLPAATIETVPGAGHVANLDAPVAFNEMVDRLLASA